MRQQVSSCFPRFHRRGLIEGVRSSSRKRGISEVFRGFTAAASLKADGVVLDTLNDDPAVFRGFTAAASLKGASIANSGPTPNFFTFSAVSPPRPH